MIRWDTIFPGDSVYCIWGISDEDEQRNHGPGASIECLARYPTLILVSIDRIESLSLEHGPLRGKRWARWH
jgi:hypothetical protein